MRVVIAALAAALCFATAMAAEQWKDFRDPAGAFAVEFPDVPSISKSLGSNKDGHVIPPSARYMAVEGTVALVVTVTDLTSSVEPENAIEGAANGVANGGTLVSDTNVTLGGHDGRSVTVAEATTITSAQIFCFNGHVYQTLVVGPKTPTPGDQAVIDRFNRSFHFL